MNAPDEDRQARLRALVEAGIALSSELSLDAVLQKLVEAAAELTGARYAALGVIDSAGTQLERFVTTGIDAETHAQIGDLPRGRGILGVLIREARTLRLADLAADPRSVGFPEHHPPMKTFLGVPILLRGVAYGNLYLTEKADGAEFTQEDEDLGTLLAAQAAVAIENARLYESATNWLRQLESLNEVGNALASELDSARLLDLIATRTRELVGARLVTIALPTLDGALRIEAAAGEGVEGMIGRTFAPDSSKTGRVFERARSERVDSVLDDPEVDQAAARTFGIHAALYVPLLARARAIGVLVAHDREGPDPRFTDDDLRLAETFAARAAIAVNLAERVSRDALRRVVAAQELERKRLARELHDETGQALTSIILGLRTVDDARSDEERREALRGLRELVLSTLNEVRQLAVELRPKALDDFGLVPALERLGDTFQQKSGITVHFEAQLGEQRLPAETETALYRIVQEALTNVAKHSGAANVSVLLTRKDGAVVAVVEDDGRGLAAGAEAGDGLGLVGMRERVSLLGGRLALEAGTVGTTVVAEVPA
jgi:two-component system, NarL family, sensor histidine kinase DevS